MGLIQRGDASITPASVEAKMHLPAAMVEPFKKVVLAGLRVMFDQKTHAMMVKQLSGPEPLPQKIGEGIAGLMSILFQEAQRSIPPQLIIPAGLVLLAHAVQYLQKAGQPVSAADFGQATQIMTDALLRAFKIDPNKLAAAGQKGAARV